MEKATIKRGSLRKTILLRVLICITALSWFSDCGGGGGNSSGDSKPKRIMISRKSRSTSCKALFMAALFT